MRSFINYAQFDEFWERLDPLTPYGKDQKRARPLYTSLDELQSLWEQSDCAAELLETEAFSLSQIRYFLKRLPRFRTDMLALYDEADIFEYKKFLANYRKLVEQLPERQRQLFALDFRSQELERLLNVGDQYAETFYIADSYSPELSEVRAQIRDLDRQIEEQNRALFREIEERWDWTFSADFLVVSSLTVQRLQGGQSQDLERLVSLEPYDGEHLLVRPRPQGSVLRLKEMRQQLSGRERAAETRILELISAQINSDFADILNYRARVATFDMALARAALAQRYRLIRPTLSSDSSAAISIEQGRFIPCQENCERLHTAYIPLDWSLDTNHAVLFGSNMGGKTISLKTLAFLQLCVQTGLYVPAQSFSTSLFKHFHYIGEGRCDTPQQGLSGFGFEMSQFCEAYEHFEEPTLVLFDEFARTTNSREAEALISAILGHLITKSQVHTIFSSHFHGIERYPEVSFFKMRGLQREAIQAQQTLDTETPSQRLQRLNGLIDYRIQPDPETLESSDALAIASLLGVPQGIVSAAVSKLGDSSH